MGGIRTDRKFQVVAQEGKVTRKWPTLIQLNGLLGFAFLLLVLALLLGKRLHARPALQLLLLSAFLAVMAAGSVVTLLGFYSETRTLASTHRRHRDPLRLSLQWLVFLGAAAILTFSTLLFTVAAVSTITSIFGG